MAASVRAAEVRDVPCKARKVLKIKRRLDDFKSVSRVVCEVAEHISPKVGTSVSRVSTATAASKDQINYL